MRTRSPGESTNSVTVYFVPNRKQRMAPHCAEANGFAYGPSTWGTALVWGQLMVHGQVRVAPHL